jgi:hypothetical protein
VIAYSLTRLFGQTGLVAASHGESFGRDAQKGKLPRISAAQRTHRQVQLEPKPLRHRQRPVLGFRG